MALYPILSTEISQAELPEHFHNQLAQMDSIKEHLAEQILSNREEIEDIDNTLKTLFFSCVRGRYLRLRKKEELQHLHDNQDRLEKVEIFDQYLQSITNAPSIQRIFISYPKRSVDKEEHDKANAIVQTLEDTIKKIDAILVKLQMLPAVDLLEGDIDPITSAEMLTKEKQQITQIYIAIKSALDSLEENRSIKPSFLAEVYLTDTQTQILKKLLRIK